jgi:hypothetical protein
MAARPGGVGQQRREAQHPPVDGDMVDLDTALGGQLLDDAVGQAESGNRRRRTAGVEQGGGDELSCRQSRCWNAVAANATAPCEPAILPAGAGLAINA